MSDLELLRIEMDLLWGADLFGREITPHPPMAIAVSREGDEVRFAASTPAELHSRWAEIGAQGAWRNIDLSERLQVTGGPSFLMYGREVAPEAPFRIVDSNSGFSPTDLGRPNVWGDDTEWEELLEERLGPWALALRDDRVVGVCYTPVASQNAAEAGVWTDVEERGRGCAPLVTAAWANVARRRFKTLFYSTGFENAASQAVARKLGLRPLGSIHQFRSVL